MYFLCPVRVIGMTLSDLMFVLFVGFTSVFLSQLVFQPCGSTAETNSVSPTNAEIPAFPEICFEIREYEKLRTTNSRPDLCDRGSISMN